MIKLHLSIYEKYNDLKWTILKNEKRALNYPIKKFESANYIEMVYSGNGKLVSLLNKEVKRDENVIRNITIKLF